MQQSQRQQAIETKKVKDLTIDLSEHSNLGTGSFNLKTYKGYLENTQSKKREELVIKQMKVANTQVITSRSEVDLSFYYQKYFAFMQVHKHQKFQKCDCPYLVKAIKSATTSTSFYYGFQRCKFNLQKLSIEQKAKFNDEDLLSLLECAANALKKLSEAGSIHGNLKLQNILFYEQDQTGKKYYKLSDAYGFKWLVGEEGDVYKTVFLKVAQRNRNDNETSTLISPEALQNLASYSIKSGIGQQTLNIDIYALGVICFLMAYRVHPQQRNFVQLKNDYISKPVRVLLEKMIDINHETRLDLLQLCDEIQKIKGSQQAEAERFRYIDDKGYDPNIVAALIKSNGQKKQGQNNSKTSFKNEFIKRIDVNQIKLVKAITCRSRAQFYYIAADVVQSQLIDLKALQISEVYLNYMIFACHITIAQSYRSASRILEEHDDVLQHKLYKLVTDEFDEYLAFFNKVVVLFGSYVQDLEISAQVQPQRQDYANWYSTINKVLDQFKSQELSEKLVIFEAVSLVLEDMVEKSAVRRAKLNDKVSILAVRALNFILLVNRLEYFESFNKDTELIVDYAKIIEYLKTFNDLENLIQG